MVATMGSMEDGTGEHDSRAHIAGTVGSARVWGA